MTAAVPIPFANPAVPLPASVRTLPPPSTRIVCPWISDTYSTPSPSTAIPPPPLKLAFSSGPSDVAKVPFPAKVPTCAVTGFTIRMRRLPSSDRKRVPPTPTTPQRMGLPKRAFVPTASM